MNKILLVLLFLLFAETCFAQKDTVVTNLPMVDGKLVYSGSVNAPGRDSIALDSTVNNWLKVILNTIVHVLHHRLKLLRAVFQVRQCLNIR
jgi:hypothetical protein